MSGGNGANGTTQVLPSVAAAKKKSPLLLVALVAAPGLLGVAFAKVGLAPPAHAEKPAAEVFALQTIELPELIVNLADTHGQRYLKVRVAVLIKSPDPEAAKAQLGTNAIALRDSLIGLLSAKSLELVLAPESRDALRKEILEAINKAAFATGKTTVERVFFMEFIVQ